MFRKVHLLISQFLLATLASSQITPSGPIADVTADQCTVYAVYSLGCNNNAVAGLQCTKNTIYSPSCSSIKALSQGDGGYGGAPALGFFANFNNGATGPFNQFVDMIFPVVIHNTGNAYNPTTGHFTAPSKGLYHFSLTITSLQDQWTDGGILLNGNWMAWAYANIQRGYSSAATSATLVLNPGDQVWAQLSQGATALNVNEVTVFGGFLVAPM